MAAALRLIQWPRWTWAEWTLAALVVGFVALFGVNAWLTYQTADYGVGWDLAIFDQATWLLSRFQTPFLTVLGLHAWADHGSFILVLLAPLYWLWADPRLLQLCAVVAIAGGAIPVYALSRAFLGSRGAALGCAYLYLSYTPIQFLAFREFHPEVLGVFFLLVGCWALTRRRRPLFFVALVLTMSCKETGALAVATLGLYLLLRREWRIGVPTALLGGAWFALVMKVVMPLASGGHAYPHLLYYQHLGDTSGEVLATCFLRPSVVWREVGKPEGVRYLVQLLAPWGFLPCLDPLGLLPALPNLLINLMSSFWLTRFVTLQYTAFIVPFVVLAAVRGMGRAAQGVRHFCQQRLAPDPQRFHNLTLAGLGTFCFIASTVAHPPGEILSALAQKIQRLREQGPELQAFRQAIDQIEPTACISAASNYLPWVAQSTNVYLFPNPFRRMQWGPRRFQPEALSKEELAARFQERRVDYVLLNLDQPWPLDLPELRAYVATLQATGRYEIVARCEETILFRRKTSADR